MNIGKCTWKRGSRGIPQKMYHCRTCGLIGDLGICKECAEKCHAGHSVFEVPGLKTFNCDCGGECGKRTCKCIPNNCACTSKRIGTNLSQQHVWYCKTCNMPIDEGLCNVCAEKCHAGHQLIDKGIWFSFTCYCGSGKNCMQCQAKNVVIDTPSSPRIGERIRTPSPADVARPPFNDTIRTKSPYDQERSIVGQSPRCSPLVTNSVRSVISPAQGNRIKTPVKQRPHVTFVDVDIV